MPDYPKTAIDAYFWGVAQRAEQQSLSANQDLAKARLAFEMKSHADLMAQHAKEFSAEQDYKDSMLKLNLSKEARAAKNEIRDDLDRFEQKGGFFMPKPQDIDASSTMNSGSPQTAGLDMFKSLRQPTQPVGPVAPLESPSMEGLASGQMLNTPPDVASIPQQFRSSLPAAMQMPDPNVARQQPDMEGQPEGSIAMRTTPQEQILQAARARFNAAHENDIDVPPQVNAWAGGNLPAKLPVDKVVDFLKARENDLRARQLASDSNMVRLHLGEQADETRRFGMLLIAANKEKASMDQDDIAANHQSVMLNPDSFHELDPKAKQKERTQLAKLDLPAPVKLNPTQLGTEEYARRAITSIETVNNMLNDPTMAALIKRRSGAILGRVGDLEQDAGATAGLSDDEARKIQDFRSSIRYLTFQEGKALFGSRIPVQLMKELQSTSPKSTESIAMLKGSMDAVRKNAEKTLISAETTRFGGKMRSDFYKLNNIKETKGVKEVPVPGFPTTVADRLSEGIAKTLTRSDGDHSYVKRNGVVYEMVDK